MKNKSIRIAMTAILIALMIFSGCKTNEDTRSKKAEEFANLFFEQVKFYKRQITEYSLWKN